MRKILLVSTLGNVEKTVWRIYKLMLGFKGLNQYVKQEMKRGRVKLSLN